MVVSKKTNRWRLTHDRADIGSGLSVVRVVGRLPKLMRRDAKQRPDHSQGTGAAAVVPWLGARAAPASYGLSFTALRVRRVQRDLWRPAPRVEVWRLIEWPADETEAVTARGNLRCSL